MPVIVVKTATEAIEEGPTGPVSVKINQSHSIERRSASILVICDQCLSAQVPPERIDQSHGGLYDRGQC
jgi:hypothetical protein